VDDITIGTVVVAIPIVGVEAGDEAGFSNAVDEEEGIIVDEEEVVEENEGQAGMTMTRITDREILIGSMMENLVA